MAARGGVSALAAWFGSLFAVWIAGVSAVALVWPWTLLWLSPAHFPGLMGLLMFSVGITIKPKDFLLDRPLVRPLGINFLGCFAFLPLCAFTLAKTCGESREVVAGSVLLAAVNGGQASNICALLAGVDVPLSVLMTISTTLAGIVLTPALVKALLGAVIAVDALGILRSAAQVVLVPVCLGIALQALAPRLCSKMAPVIPLTGILVSVLVVGATVASCAAQIRGAGSHLHATLLLMHVLGAIGGFWASAALGGGKQECRTVAIEVAMKSSAFGFVLAVLHFEEFDVRIPAAADCIWCPLVGATLAAVWRPRGGTRDAGGGASAGSGSWAGAYRR